MRKHDLALISAPIHKRVSLCSIPEGQARANVDAQSPDRGQGQRLAQNGGLLGEAATQFLHVERCSQLYSK